MRRSSASLRAALAAAALLCAYAPAGRAAPPATPCVAAVTTCPLWSDLYDGPAGYSDWGMGSAMDRAGTRMFTGGYETYTSTTVAGVVVGYDASNGTRLWKAEQQGIDGMTVVWSTVQSSADGARVFAAGTMYSGEKCRIVAVSYDGKTGVQRWYAPQPVGPAPCEYYTQSVLSPDGRTLYVTSDAADKDKVRRGVTLAFDARDGRRLWSANVTYNAPGTQNWKIAVAPDGRRVYVVGDVLDKANHLSVGWRVYAYDARTGRQVWATSYDCRRTYGSAYPVQENKSPYCIMPGGVAATRDRVFITGSNTIGYGTSQVAAFAATTGKPLWHTDRDKLQSFLYLNTALVVTADGAGVVAGRVRIDPMAVNPPRFVVERYAAATGKVEWTQTVDGNAHSAAYCGGCGPVLATDGTSQVFVTGAYPLGDSVLVTAGLDLRSGAVRWSAQHVWHLVGASSELPQTLNYAPGSRRLGIAGAVLDPNGACAVFLACYDAGTVVYQIPG